MKRTKRNELVWYRAGLLLHMAKDEDASVVFVIWAAFHVLEIRKIEENNNTRIIAVYKFKSHALKSYPAVQAMKRFAEYLDFKNKEGMA